MGGSIGHCNVMYNHKKVQAMRDSREARGLRTTKIEVLLNEGCLFEKLFV